MLIKTRIFNLFDFTGPARDLEAGDAWEAGRRRRRPQELEGQILRALGPFVLLC